MWGDVVGLVAVVLLKKLECVAAMLGFQRLVSVGGDVPTRNLWTCTNSVVVGDFSPGVAALGVAARELLGCQLVDLPCCVPGARKALIIHRVYCCGAYGALATTVKVGLKRGQQVPGSFLTPGCYVTPCSLRCWCWGWC